jgi:predicted permease
MALGARSPRLVRQHLTESLTLALLSGTAGLVFAQWFAAGVLSLAPQGDAPVIDLRFDLPVVAFGLTLSVAAGLLVGLVPAWTLSRSAVRTALAAGVTVKRGWARRVGVGRPLVAAQIALSLVLLVVAGLLVRSLANLQSAQIGFASKGLVLFDLDATAAGYAPQQRNAATERIAASLRQLPHVGSVSWSSFALLNGLTWNTGITVEREAKTRPGACNLLWIAPGYHRTLKIPVLAGRTIDERDCSGTTRVAVVNQAFARKYFGGGSVLGHVVTFEDDPEPLRVEIVGLVGDTMYSRIRRGVEPIAFLADAQRALPIGPSFVLAYEGDQATLARDVTRLVHQLEPALPVMRLRSYQEQVARQLTMERSLSLAASAFGVVALLLAAIGLYGVVAFAVARRTSELGVRLALGATRRGVLRLVLTDSAKVIVPGACTGVAAALAATRLVKVVLYGLTPTDAGTMALAVALLLAVSAVAAFLPARRAAAIDPAEALRCE